MKKCCQTQQGSRMQPPDHQLNVHTIKPICMMSQSLFSGKKKEEYFKISSAEIFTQSAKH